MNKFYNNLFFYIGLLCSMNAIALPYGGGNIAFYNVLIILLVAGTVVNNYIVHRKILYIYHEHKMIYILLFSFVLSLLGALVMLPPVWYSNAVSLTIKFLLLIGGFFLFVPRKILYDNMPRFFSGLYFAAWLQMVWGLLQLIWWYSYSVNINEYVFGDVLHIGDGRIDWNQNIMGGIICRMSGFSWEPANFAGLMVIGWLLAKSSCAKIIFSLAILLSTSRTGILAFLVVLTVKGLALVLKKNTRILVTKKETAFFVFGICTCGYLFAEYGETLLFFVERAFITINGIFTGIATSTNTSANIHKAYYAEFFSVLSNSNWWQILFGYGPFCAGYPYDTLGIVEYGNNIVWNPESDFITLFVGNGLFGGAIYYLMLANALLKKRREAWFMVLAILSMGITYLYARGAWMFMVVMFICSSEYNLSAKTMINKKIS